MLQLFSILTLSYVLLTRSLHFPSSVFIFHSYEHKRITQVTDLLLCWSLIKNWCSLKCSYFVEGFACWCYLGMWKQIPFILLVGQLCHQWCKLWSPLCNHFVAIHIQKQTLTKCSLSLSIETLAFSSLACNGRLSMFCICHHCSLYWISCIHEKILPEQLFVFILTLSLVSFLFIKTL